LSNPLRVALSGAAVLAVAAGIWIAVGHVGSGVAATQHSSATANRTVLTDKNLNPFGAPAGNGDSKVPPPPEEPTLVPTIGTKTTHGLYGANPFDEAVSVTQHIWPAVVPLNDPTENNNVPDRPRGLTLLTPDNPLTAITAVPLLHFPDDAPILFVTKNGIPQVTLNEIKRLGDTGISRFNNVDAFLVGAAANPAVESQLKAAGLKYVEVTASSVPELANKVDQLYGSVENPDTGVADMGNGIQNVMVGSMDGTDYRYLRRGRARVRQRGSERGGVVVAAVHFLVAVPDSRLAREATELIRSVESAGRVLRHNNEQGSTRCLTTSSSPKTIPAITPSS
jgi:hypothetical protein